MTDRWANGCMDEWIDGWMMDGRMDGWVGGGWRGAMSVGVKSDFLLQGGGSVLQGLSGTGIPLLSIPESLRPADP